MGRSTIRTTETYIINTTFDDEETLFKSKTDANGATRITVSNNDGILTFTNANNSTNGNSCATYDLSNNINSNTSNVNIEFDLKLTDIQPSSHNMFTFADNSLTEQIIKDYSNSGAIFNIGTKRGKWPGTNTTVNYFTINNQYVKFEQQNDYNTLVNNWLHIILNIDLIEKKVSYQVIDLSNNNVLKTESNINYLDENANILNVIDYDSRINNAINYIDNLKISKS